MGIAIMSLSGGLLLTGKLEYPNYFNAPVFAPYAFITGALAIFVALKARRS
ncbi:MAG TPA: hypothetical protein VJN69_05700 [Candidatus Acidoferrales bacterium]|nr:hypothetical protein [Candidatus Acidoferrales bacterium]